MIWESWPWKRDLTRRALALRKRRQQRRWPEASCANVEQDIFLSAYAIRKLMDAFNVSDEVKYTSLRSVEYRACGRNVDLMNWHKLDELYDLSNGVDGSVGLRDFCNQVIHSFVFSLAFTPRGGLDGFFVASDREKDRRLVYFDIGSVIDALMRVAEDDIVSAYWSRDGIGSPLRVIRKSSQPEATAHKAGHSGPTGFGAKR